MMNLQAYLQRNREAHKAFFESDRPGDRMIFTSCWKAASSDFDFGGWSSRCFSNEPIVEFPIPMTDEFLKHHAFDMGRETVRLNQLVAEYHQTQLDDDYYPGVIFHPGAGYQAAMSTGANVTFGVGTDRFGASYMEGPLLKTLDETDRVFNHNNRWIDYGLDFWRGVASCDLAGLAVTPRYNRSPLDLAWDLRGAQLFIDLYDEPDGTAQLLMRCAESILEVDQIFRSEIPLLRNGIGGAQGVALARPTMILNGDPLDLISEEMVLRFNNPSLERITDSAMAIVLHHHSVGISRAPPVSRVKSLDVQEIYQDNRGPRIAESISDDLIAASLRTPLFIEFPVSHITQPLEEWAARLVPGRFVVHLWCSSIDEAKRCVHVLRKK